VSVSYLLKAREYLYILFNFIGFSKEDTAISIGHKHVVKLLQLSKKRNNVDNHQQNVKCGGNGYTYNMSHNYINKPSQPPTAYGPRSLNYIRNRYTTYTPIVQCPRWPWHQWRGEDNFLRPVSQHNWVGDEVY